MFKSRITSQATVRSSPMTAVLSALTAVMMLAVLMLVVGSQFAICLLSILSSSSPFFLSSFSRVVGWV